MVCQYVAATVPVGKGKDNQLLKSAQDISLTNIDSKVEGVEAEPNKPFDPEDHDAAVQRAANRNKEGSFERITRGMLK